MYNEIDYLSYKDKISYKIVDDLLDYNDISTIKNIYMIRTSRDMNDIRYIILHNKSEINIYRGLDEWYYVKRYPFFENSVMKYINTKYYKCDQMEGLLKLLTCIMR